MFLLVDYETTKQVGFKDYHIGKPQGNQSSNRSCCAITGRLLAHLSACGFYGFGIHRGKPDKATSPKRE